MRQMYSYLHDESGDTPYSDRARRIRFNKFSALRHGDVLNVRTFVLHVLSCKQSFYVGTIQKTIARWPGNQLPDYKTACFFYSLNRVSDGRYIPYIKGISQKSCPIYLQELVKLPISRRCTYLKLRFFYLRYSMCCCTIVIDCLWGHISNFPAKTGRRGKIN